MALNKLVKLLLSRNTKNADKNNKIKILDNVFCENHHFREKSGHRSVLLRIAPTGGFFTNIRNYELILDLLGARLFVF